MKKTNKIVKIVYANRPLNKNGKKNLSMMLVSPISIIKNRSTETIADILRDLKTDTKFIKAAEGNAEQILTLLARAHGLA